MLIKANTATMCKSIGKNAISIYSLPAIKSIFFADWNSTYTCPDHFTTIISLESSIVGSIRIVLAQNWRYKLETERALTEIIQLLGMVCDSLAYFETFVIFLQKKTTPPPKKTHIKITHIGACKLFSKQYQ